MVLLAVFTVVSMIPTGASAAPIHPADPVEWSGLASTLALRSVPTPSGVPAGLTPMTQANHPCWPIAPNGSTCIQVDMLNYTQPDVVPNPLSGQLNTSWNLYPKAAETIHFQVLSTINLASCEYYNPPTWMGTSCTGSALPTGAKTGWDAYLFLTVIDVMWQDVCWYCNNDGTQWHANAGTYWAPGQGNPYVGKVPTDPSSTENNWVFDLNISAYGSNGAENFPNGTWVNWNVTQNFWNGSAVAPTGFHRVQYCAPQCGGNLNGGMFYYFTRNFWFYDAAPPGSLPPYGPGGSNEAPDPFSANLNLTYYPVVPNIGDQVVVDLRIQNINNLTGGLINSQATIVILNAWYPNGTFWRSWVSGFTPLAYPYNETWHARLDLPTAFFEHSGTKVQWFVQAYDQYGHLVQSRNFTQIVSTIGTCPGQNFSACLNVTTLPTGIEKEGWNGWVNTTPYSIPGVPVDQDVNVTITTVDRAIDIEAAYIILHVTYSTTQGNQTGLYTLHRITLNQYYFDVPALPEGSNVTFVIKAIDFNETSVISHPYRYFVPLNIAPPQQYCFFYIQVFNAATNSPINGANVTIIAEAGTLKIVTVTALDGVAYPNITGEEWTPRFIAANESVTVKVQVRGFQGVGLPTPSDTIVSSFTCLHTMDTTQVITAGANYQVLLKNDVLNYSLNSAYTPPVFSEVISPPVGAPPILGMIAATAVTIPIYLVWKRQREVAAAEEKRITL
jgi:hypothetical protein